MFAQNSRRSHMNSTLTLMRSGVDENTEGVIALRIPMSSFTAVL